METTLPTLDEEVFWSSFEPTPSNPQPKLIAEEFISYKIQSLIDKKNQLEEEEERRTTERAANGKRNKQDGKSQIQNTSEELQRKIDAAKRSKVIFAAVGGSVAYGLAEPRSDVDFIAVYAFDTRDMLSLFSSTSSPPLPLSMSNTPYGPPPDINVYEAKKFCELLLQGNPFAIEALYIGCDEDEDDPTSPSSSPSISPFSSSSFHFGRLWFATEEFLQLRRHRKHFLTATSIYEYLNYVKGQLRKDLNHQKRKLDPKPCPGKRIYHCVRLLKECHRIAVLQLEPKVKVPEAEGERDYLVSVRKDKVEREDFHTYAQQLIKEIEEKEPWSHLPQNADHIWLNSWLLNLRYSYISSSSSSSSFPAEGR